MLRIKYLLKFSGLSENAEYEVFDYDNQGEILVKKARSLWKTALK